MSTPPPVSVSVPPRAVPSVVRFVPPPGPGLVARLAGADRALVAGLVGAHRAEAEWRGWRAVTHLGGTTATTLACALPLVAGGAAQRAGMFTTAVVLLSQGAVHLVKRVVGRPRPARAAAHAQQGHGTLVARAAEPDAFSFPSGHAAAAAAVAFGYATAWPAAAPALLVLAVLVAWSRVVLGVHYLIDVVAGALVAAGAVGVVHLALPGLLPVALVAR